MTSADTTDRSQSDAIAFEFELRHSPAKVWRALTEPKLLAEWLFPVLNLKLELGAPFKIQAPPKTGWDGTVDCEFVAIEAQRKLSYTWRLGTFLDTVVTFTLTPTAGGTRLTVVQSGFKPDQKQAFGGARYGWRLMGKRLIDLLAEDRESTCREGKGAEA